MANQLSRMPTHQLGTHEVPRAIINRADRIIHQPDNKVKFLANGKLEKEYSGVPREGLRDFLVSVPRWVICQDGNDHSLHCKPKELS